MGGVLRCWKLEIQHRHQREEIFRRAGKTHFCKPAVGKEQRTHCIFEGQKLWGISLQKDTVNVF